MQTREKTQIHRFGLEFIHNYNSRHAYINIYYKIIHLKTWMDYSLSLGESMKILPTGNSSSVKPQQHKNAFLLSGKFVVSFEVPLTYASMM